MSEQSIVGCWKLVTYKFRKTDGSTVYPFGEKAMGSIIYTKTGRFSAQLMRIDRPQFAIPDQMKGTPAEIEASFKGCISYFGSYEMDLDQGVITHRVEGSIFPNMEGSKQKRGFELRGDLLQLKIPSIILDGEKASAIFLWQRMT